MKWAVLPLRTQVIGTTVLVHCLLLVLLYCGIQYKIRVSFSKLEAERTAEEVKQIFGAIDQELESLRASTTDWSRWNDLYHFTINENQNFLTTNCTPTVNNSLQIDFFAIVNAQGKLLFSQAVNLDTMEVIPLPADVKSLLQPGNALLAHADPQAEVAGLLALDSGVLIICSRPIVTAQQTGPIGGAMVMGRYLDERLVERLRESTHLPFTLFRTDGNNLPSGVSKDILQTLNLENPVQTVVLHEDKVTGLGLIPDLESRFVVGVALERPRTIYTQGMQLLRFFALAFLVVTAAATVCLVLFVDRKLLSRIIPLGETLQQIGKDQDFSAQITVEGNDELGKVGMLFNRMMTELNQAQQTLTQQRHRLDTILQNAPDGIVLFNGMGEVLFFNYTSELLFGYSAEEMSKENIRLLLPELQMEDEAKGVYGFLEKLKKRADEAHEVLGQRKDGTLFPMGFSVNEINENGSSLFTGIMRDISEAKQQEASLRDREETMRAITNAVDDGIMMMDPNGIVCFCNKGVSAICGWEYEEIIGKDLHRLLVPSEVFKEYERGMVTFRRSGTGLVVGKTLESRALHKDGHTIPVEISIFPVFRRGGWHAVGVVRNISQRKAAEATLRASEEKFRQIIDNIGMGVTLIGKDMRVLEINRQMRAWFPEADANINPFCYQVYNMPSGEEICGDCPVSKTFKDGKVYETTRVLPHPEGARSFRIVSTPLHDDNGDLVSAIEMVENITEKLRIERELGQAQKLEAVGRLAAGIAHEINTPIQYVGDNIEFLQIAYASFEEIAGILRKLVEVAEVDESRKAVVREASEIIENANLDYIIEQAPRALEQSLEGVGRVATIVQAMKEFSHPGASEKTTVDLNQYIRSTVTVSRNEWKYVADLDLDLDPSLPQVLCLPGEFNQVILNMIVNSSHAIQDVVEGTSGDKGKITIQTRQDREWVEIRVSDTGAGIPEENRQRIFDPFFTTKGVGRGTGQGLAIAHNVIVDKHNGTIAVESQPGVGTTFIIRMPIGN